MISEKRIGGRPTTEVDDEAVVTLGLRVPGWLKRQLMEADVENHRTLSQEARRRLELSFNGTSVAGSTQRDCAQAARPPAAEPRRIALADDLPVAEAGGKLKCRDCGSRKINTMPAEMAEAHE